MIPAIVISVMSCLCMIVFSLVRPKLKLRTITINTYWLAPLLGALLLTIFNLMDVTEIFAGLTSNAAINPVKILALFLSVTVLSIFLDETGLFKYLANAVSKRTGSNQLKLFTALYFVISIITVFVSNDIVILTFTPFLCYFCKNAKINPIPYLVSCFVAANTCSMLLVTGNPTNIYLATSNGIGFIEYLLVMALPTLLATIVAYVVMLLLFRKKLRRPITCATEKVTLKKPLMLIGLVILLLVKVFLAISSFVGVEMWLVATVAVGVLTIAVLVFALFKKEPPRELGRTLRRVPWELVPFVVSMFILVLALEKYDVTAMLGSLLGNQNTIPVYGVTSTIFANLINNIPMSALFSAILVDSSAGLDGVYAAIIGSNIGAFLTPIGALAGIMWSSILKTNNVNFSFARFLGYGVIIAPLVLLVALLGLALVVAV